jgi:hypothetical protein|tara:strand:+ start:4744 stop:4986 length:243 start_codon:yes stop_codon:yes gene_type:complete
MKKVNITVSKGQRVVVIFYILCIIPILHFFYTHGNIFEITNKMAKEGNFYRLFTWAIFCMAVVILVSLIRIGAYIIENWD